MKLPEEYLNRMRRQLGSSFPSYLSAMDEPPKPSLRVNTLKIDPNGFRNLFPEPCIPLPGTDDGFRLPFGFRPGQDPLHAAGLYYMQEASAQMPARLPKIEGKMTILDLCAAPGGKSTQLAARMACSGVLVANDISPQRAAVLTGNLERMGVQNAIVTNMDPRTLCEEFRGSFDIVLCDAPCAGEGMFRRDPQAVADWSYEHVLSCASRERAILDEAAKAVKPGGQLIYSTCSFSLEEDEENVNQFLDTHPDFSQLMQGKLFPHSSEGEGQYMALFIREGEYVPSRYTAGKSLRCPAWEAFQKECSPLDGQVLRLRDGRILLVPPLPFDLKKLRIVRAGLLLGEDREGRLIPSHALAMAAPATPLLHTEDLSDEETAVYLRGETIPRNSIKGWCAVTYRGYALGLAKSDGTVLKNHYPKGLRIR